LNVEEHVRLVINEDQMSKSIARNRVEGFVCNALETKGEYGKRLPQGKVGPGNINATYGVGHHMPRPFVASEGKREVTRKKLWEFVHAMTTVETDRLRISASPLYRR